MDTDQGPQDLGPRYHPGFDDDPPRGRMVAIGTGEKPWWLRAAADDPRAPDDNSEEYDNDDTGRPDAEEPTKPEEESTR